MEITLAEALSLRSVIKGTIDGLYSERENSSTVEWFKGEEIEWPEPGFETLTSAYQKAVSDLRKLDSAIAYHNSNTKLEWDGKEISIVESIQLAKDMRNEIYVLKRFASMKPEKVVGGYGLSAQNNAIRSITFDQSKLKETVAKMEREVNRLSSLIEYTNHVTKIDLDDELAELKEYL